LPLIALWSYAHRVGTTFALDWSKAREAKEENKNKNKSKGIKGKRQKGGNFCLPLPFGLRAKGCTFFKLSVKVLYR
jgi:hypothetical protein